MTAATVVLTADQAKAIEKVARVRVRSKELKLWRAPGGGMLVVDEVLGKHEVITWALAVDEAV